MNELRTKVTLLCNRTKTYCDYSISLRKVTKVNQTSYDYRGEWTEIPGNTRPRSGFTRMNPMQPEGIVIMGFKGIGSWLWLGQMNVTVTNTSRLAVVNIFTDVWQYAFPASGERMAKKTEFGLVVEPGIALFWNGVISG